MPYEYTWKVEVKIKNSIQQHSTRISHSLYDSIYTHIWTYICTHVHIYIHGKKLQWLSSKESTCNAGDTSSIPGSGRPPGEGNGNPLQYSYLKIPMDKEAWWATVHGVAKESDMT